MASRSIAIRITIDNRDAINAAKAQAIAMKSLSDETDRHTHLQNGLTNSFIKGNLAARAISMAYEGVRNSLRFVIGESAQLEFAFAKVSAVTGASAKEMDSLKASVWALGRATSSSVTDLANTALELAKLGFEGKGLETVLGGVARLSNALGDSLESTGQLVGGISQTFALSTKETEQVAQKLFVATGRSAASIASFGTAFGLAGNVAANAGVSFEELSAAIAGLSNQGIKASTIGTGLRTFITHLSMEGSKAQQALGGSFAELGLTGAIEKMASIRPDTGSIFEMFGKPGSAVANGLIGMKDAYGQFLSEIQSGNPTLNEAGEKINDTLIGSITRLKNAVLELFDVWNKAPQGFFKGAIQDLSDGMKQFTDSSRDQEKFEAFMKKQANATPLSASTPRWQDIRKTAAKELGLKGDINLIEEEDVKQAFLRRENAQKVKDDALRLFNTRRTEDFNRATGGFKPDTSDRTKIDFKDEPGKTPKIKNTEVDFQKLEKATSRRLAAEAKQADREEAEPSKRAKADTHLKSVGDSILANQDQFSRGGTSDENKLKLFEAQQMEYRRIYADNLEVMNALDKQRDDYKQQLADQERTRQIAFAGSMVSSLITMYGAFAAQDKKHAMQRKILAMAQIAINTAVAVSNVWGQTGIFGIAAQWAPIAAGAAQLAVVSQQKFASGTDKVFRQPTSIMVGDAGAERVRITPRSKMSEDRNSGGGGDTYVIQGDVYDYDKFQRKVKMAQDSNKRAFV
jgi:TP901 family phage tail tape measure protein